MILYRKEPYPLQMKNIMMLDDISTGGVVYVDKLTYDQAVMLYGRHEGDVNAVMRVIKPVDDSWKDVPGLYELMKKFKEEAPEPLNMLAPFLTMLGKNKGIEFDPENMEMAYGILHQMSQQIDFNGASLIPANMRAGVTIPTYLLKNYQQSWDSLCETLEEHIKMSYVQAAPAPVATQSYQNEREVTAPVPATPESQVYEDPQDTEDQVFVEDNFFADLFSQMGNNDDEKKDEPKKDKPKEDKKSSDNSSSGDSEILGEDQKAKEAQQTAAILDEFDF